MMMSGCEPGRSDLPPRDLLEKGWGHFRLEEFAEAQLAFETALEKVAASDADLRLNAIYGLGLIASLSQQGTKDARQRFEQVIAEDHSPGRAMAAWAALALVREAHLPDTADAIPDTSFLAAAYTRMMTDYPGTSAAEEAFLHRTAMRVESLQAAEAQQAIVEVRAYVTAHPQARLRTALLALQSTAHQTLGEYPEALAAAIASVESKEPDPANPRQNNILEYYRIGMMAQFDVGDFPTARAYYGRFLAEYPRDQRAFAVKLLLSHLDRTEAALGSGGPVPQLSALARDPEPAGRPAAGWETGREGRDRE